MQRSSSTKNTLAVFLVFCITLLGYGLLAVPAQAVSQLVPTMDQSFTGSGLPMVSLTVFIVGIIRIFFGLLGVIALALLIYGGVIWMTSAGDPGKVTKAKQIIYNTVIGLIVIFSAFAISSFLINFLRGTTGTGGTGGGNIPGGIGDFGRSGIGAGPIESVYPHPNQINVPINSRIAVTFKEAIIPNSICVPAGNGTCDGGEMKNISICEISATSTNAACLGGVYDVAAYGSTTVAQVSPTDFKTFVFRTKKYLGADDGKTRIFKVVLGNGIMASSTGKSIFTGYRSDSYVWSFKTNGVLDLTPPEVAQFQIYPNPDNVADDYFVDTAAIAGNARITMTGQPTAYHPVMVRNADTGKDIPYFANALVNVPLATTTNGELATGFKLYFNGTIYSSSTGTAAKNYDFTVSSDGMTANLIGDWSELGVSGNSLPIRSHRQISTNAGFSLTATGDLPQASGWRLIVTPETPLTQANTIIFANGSTTYPFAYVSLSQYAYPSTLTAKVTQPDGSLAVKTVNTIAIGLNSEATIANTVSAFNRVLRTLITATATETGVSIVPVSAGRNSLTLTGFGVGTANLSGTDRISGRRALPVGTKLDPYNNSIFRITFTEAIAPLNLDNSIIVTVNGVAVNASTTITNGYRTIELAGTKSCGLANSCGQPMYCWLDPNASTGSSSPVSIEIKAARLRFCINGDETQPANSWCSSFGGSCNSNNDNGRCKLTSGLYYPQAFWVADNLATLRGLVTGDEGIVAAQNLGVVDMAENSFNGSFDQAPTSKGYLSGNAQGRSGSGFGMGNSDSYSANSHLTDNKFNYEPSTVYGDNFKWSFFVSSQIDTASPLIKTLEPVGDYALGNAVGESFGQPVKLVFNTLMRLSSLKGGFGYGKNQADPAWNIRYLLLNTITKSANPVGYWASSADVDFDQDGLADYTSTDLNHNPFDQSVSYGPVAGSGIQSITQNCFLPGNGPQGAGASTTAPGAPLNSCNYTAGGDTRGCVTDSNITDRAKIVTSTNPSSYGYMNCADISGAVTCANSCKVHNATSTNSANGSWIVTKDKSNLNGTGATGCCFGKCI